jgi:hypothetical protein
VAAPTGQAKAEGAGRQQQRQGGTAPKSEIRISKSEANTEDKRPNDQKVGGDWQRSQEKDHAECEGRGEAVFTP